MIIRKATVNDAEKLLSIYAPYVLKTAISFEYEVPSVEEFKQRIENISEKYPYLVAENNGEIVGYAYAGVFKDRAAYSHCVETTVYVKQNAKRCGIGRKLYERLEKELKAIGIINLYACIAYTQAEDANLTNDSAAFHEHMGYRMIGVFNKCGRKFGKWYDMVWMEKFIGKHE